jgi:hypothetical protein
VDRKQYLLTRLDEIGVRLRENDNALALLALGSVGVELDRLDEFSDLDFFVIVKVGSKQAFLENLDWLAVRPIVYQFLNTVDGYKLLYDDGIFGEMAVFEPHELAHIPFAKGRVVWSAAGFDATTLKPPKREFHEKPLEWHVGEILTNLYVGMARYRRGEKLSALFFIQYYAVARLIELAARIETPQPAHDDDFSPERRFEQRFPQLAQQLSQFLTGYERTPEAAKAILEFMDAHFEVNEAIKRAILALAEE